jgi:enediyne biosynthesis protein E4
MVRRPVTKLQAMSPVVWACLLFLAAIPFIWAADLPVITLENRAEESGIDYVLRNSVTAEKYSIETMIGGAAVFDFDNDGLLDIYFPNGAAIPSLEKTDPSFHNRLYRNNGDGTFTDVTQKAGVTGRGYCMGVATGDYDNDGFVDLYVTGVNYNQLFRNNGDGTFTDVTEKSGADGVHPKLGKLWAITAGWLDYDNDGLLDLFVANYLTWSVQSNPPCRSKGLRAYCHPNMFDGTPNMLYRNNGDGTFTDVSEKSQIGTHIGKAMGIAFADFDGNGFIDVFVSNDTFRNFLFQNRGDGTFNEVSILAGVAYNENGRTVAGMGADFRDIDNDGKPDIFQTAMFWDTFPLYRNTGGLFADHTNTAGLSLATRRLTAYGLGIFDFDNDGHKDLFTANGAILDNSMEVDHLPFEMPNSLFRNKGDGTFADVSSQVGASFLAAAPHRGAAFGDFNNDGRMDLVVTALNYRAQLFMNRTENSHNWIILDLVGVKSNRDGLGAVVKIQPAGGHPQYNQAATAVGYNSSSDKRVHFGLGKAAKLDRIEIRWPSGFVQVLEDIAVNQVLKITERKTGSGQSLRDRKYESFTEGAGRRAAFGLKGREIPAQGGAFFCEALGYVSIEPFEP